MHTQLLNMGFIKISEGIYRNYELNLDVTIADEKHVLVNTSVGLQKATIDELEDAIVSGGFGEF